MLHALELENFKAFGERARIPFAPITLIFGENSAGKSSILQALNLLKQTRESREAGALLLPRTEDGIVDLGSFPEMIFDHDLQRTLSIRVETTVDRRDIFRTSYIDRKITRIRDKIAIEFSFKRPSVETEVLLDQIGIYEEGSPECIAEFRPLNPTERPKGFRRRVGFFRDSRGLPLPSSKLDAVKCVRLTKEKKYWEPEFEWYKENKDRIRQQLEESLKDLQNSNEERQEVNERLNSLSAGIEFLAQGFDLNTYISTRHEGDISTVLGVHGFLPVGIMSREANAWIMEYRSLGPRRPFQIFDAAQLVVAAGRALERTLESLFPMGPFRRPPERWYIFRGTSPEDVGYRGDLLPDLLFRDSKLVKEADKWLKQLEIGYKLKVESVGDRSRDLFEVRLIDTRRKGKKDIDIALPDVGFGISQLLPFVVQSLVSEKQIISIEQPEVHVHPRLQADLGDLLAAAIKKENPNQFIIETHSEHLILRLQRLVRKQQIKPEDVSVIYVSRGPEGARAERLRLDEEGDFIDEWPGGFFLERLRELR